MSEPKHVAVIQQMNCCAGRKVCVFINTGNMTQRMANIRLINISNSVQFKVSLSRPKVLCLGHYP